MHQYWLQVAINLCGSRKELAHRMGVKRGRITAWLNHTKGISLENAIKIEKAVEGKVHRLQLVPHLDRKVKQQLQAEKPINPPRILQDKVALGIACEQALGDRNGNNGSRKSLLPCENFHKVAGIFEEFQLQEIKGRSDALAAKQAGFGNYRTYRDAKRIVEFGIPALIAAVDGDHLSISCAAKIAQYPEEKQLYFLGLTRKALIQELKEISIKKSSIKSIKNTKNLNQNMSCSSCLFVTAWMVVNFFKFHYLNQEGVCHE